MNRALVRLADVLGYGLAVVATHVPPVRRVLDRWAERVLAAERRRGAQLPPDAQTWLDDRP